MKYKHTITGEVISSYEYGKLSYQAQKNYKKVDDEESTTGSNDDFNSNLLANAAIVSSVLTDNSPSVDVPSSDFGGFSGGDCGGGGATGDF